MRAIRTNQSFQHRGSFVDRNKRQHISRTDKQSAIHDSLHGFEILSICFKPWSLSMCFYRAFVIFFGNFQSRGPVKGGFEVDSSRHFLLFRWRDTNVYFLEDFPPGWPRFFSRGVSPDEQSFWNSWRRRRWTSRSNPKRGHLVPRVFSLTIFKSYGGCVHLNTLGGEGGGRHHERNLVVLIEHTMALTRARTCMSAQTVCPLPLSFNANYLCIKRHFWTLLFLIWFLQSTVVGSRNTL